MSEANRPKEQRAEEQRRLNPVYRRKHLRPYKLPDGEVKMVTLIECCCEDRRGPSGGVCGNCTGAIPRE